MIYKYCTYSSPGSDFLIICDECGCNDIYTDHVRGELICTNCGLVIDQQLILKQEVSYPEHVTVHRCPVSKRTCSRTIIGSDRTDSAGNKLDKRKVYLLKRGMRYESSGIMRQAERLIEIIGSQLDLTPEIKQRVTYYFEKLQEATRNKPYEVLVTTAFIIATRHLRVPLPFSELAKFTKITTRQIRRNYVRLIQELRWKVPILKPQDFVQVFCEKLGVNGSTRTRVLKFLKKHRSGSGKSPKLTAASLIYRFADPKVTQLQVANVCKVSEVGIRNTLRRFFK